MSDRSIEAEHLIASPAELTRNLTGAATRTIEALKGHLTDSLRSHYDGVLENLNGAHGWFSQKNLKLTSGLILAATFLTSCAPGGTPNQYLESQEPLAVSAEEGFPEGRPVEIEDGGNITLSKDRETESYTIRYRDNVDPLYVVPGRGTDNIDMGAVTRRATGEILDPTIVHLTPADEVPERGIAVYDTAGIPVSPFDQTVKRITEGDVVLAIQVVTNYDTLMWQDEADVYEINGFHMGSQNQPERFTNGWAIGIVLDEQDNTNPVFEVIGYVPSNSVLVPAQ